MLTGVPQTWTKIPVYKIKDVYNFQKYDPSLHRHCWPGHGFRSSCFCFSSVIFLDSLLRSDLRGILYLRRLCFLYVYALTELMDRNQHARFGNSQKCAGSQIIYVQRDWFGANDFIRASIFRSLTSLLQHYYDHIQFQAIRNSL
jgi:hypothetical protein